VLKTDVKRVVALLLVLSFFSVSSPSISGCSAAGVSVATMDADGTDVIVNEDIARARTNAVRDSLRKVVEQAVGGLVAPEDMAIHFDSINKTIYSRPRQYIQHYRIIEERAADSLYTVHIEAVVSVGGIKEDLETLGLTGMGDDIPRVMVLIGLTASGEGHPDYRLHAREPSLWEETIQTVLAEKGLVVRDRSHLPAMDGDGKADLDTARIREIASLVGVDIVIAGRAQLRQGATIAGTSVKELQARVTARAVQADRGVVIASDNGYAASFSAERAKGEDEAITKAARQVAERLQTAIMAAWQRRETVTAIVSMTVSGIAGYDEYVTLRQALRHDLKGVKNVYQRRVMRGMAMFDLEVTVDAETLADRLALKDFGAFVLDIVDVTDQSIGVNIRK